MNKKITLGIIIGLSLLGIIGFTYSFFSVNITGEGKENVVTAGTLELEYLDGPGISLPQAKPGDSITKVISVKNKGTLEAKYDLIYKDLINEITGNELTISYTCKSYTDYVNASNKGTESGTCASINNQVVPHSESKIDSYLTNNISIKSGITHEYNITITFNEINDNQNYNQDKHFSSKINIIETNQATYTLSGTLLDNAGNPLTNQMVEIHSLMKTTMTDSEGYFEIKGVELGNHEFKVKNKNGNYIVEDTLKIISSETSSVNGKEVSIKEGTDSISLNIKINENGTIKEIERNKTLYEKLISDNQGGQSDENISFAEISSDTNGKGLYYTSKTNVTEDLDGDGIGERVYYYRGAVENNNVRFGGFCWRIVRTNEDGSVRLRYNGTYSNGTCPVTGTQVSVGGKIFSFYSESSLEKYNDYIWEDGTGESLAKTQVDTWYTSSGLVNYEDKIANVPYCADKSNPTSPTTGNYTSRVFFGASNRLYNIVDNSINSDTQPSYKCQDIEDKHTVEGDKWGGNGKLSKPIGLLTADEVSFAGGVYNQENQDYYLKTGAKYWLISPRRWDNTPASTFYVSSTGNIYGAATNDYARLLPVISLKSEVAIEKEGTGSYINPYVVK